MEIITRQRAIKERLHKYYTGVQCKNGHISQRYTYNSVCLECIHPKIESPLGAERALRNEQRVKRLKGIGKLQRAKFRVENSNLTTFRILVQGLALMECAELRVTDVESKARPIYGSVFSIWAFRVFPSMVPVLRRLEYQAYNAVKTVTPPAYVPPADESWPSHDPR